MFVVEYMAPVVSQRARGYLGEGPKSFVSALQDARVFVERSDTTSIPWPADDHEAAELERILESQSPVRIPVKLCDMCASTRLATGNCGVCGK